MSHEQSLNFSKKKHLLDRHNKIVSEMDVPGVPDESQKQTYYFFNNYYNRIVKLLEFIIVILS